MSDRFLNTSLQDARPKKVLLFREFGQVKKNYDLSARIVEYVSEYIFLIKKKQQKATTGRQKAKETKKEKRISVENLTGYDDIVYELALCTFELLDRVVNLSGLFI